MESLVSDIPARDGKNDNLFYSVILGLRQLTMRISNHFCRCLPAKQSENECIAPVQVSLVIVIVFILCHSIRWIPNIWELKQAGVKKVSFS
jgi:hypothetical protein